jgi:beta-fructofuranosidase
MNDKETIKAVRAYRERLLADPYRPAYHFAIPDDDGRPGDPNGCFYADGIHHLMYLYRKDGGPFHWGHVTSKDLLHWRHHEDSLVKGPQDEGCFSGGAFVDDDGAAWLSYWIFNDGAKTDGRNAGIGLAYARPPYEHWERLPDAVIPSTEWGIRDVPGADGETLRIGCADPSSIWKSNGVYYMQLGNLCALNRYGRRPESPPGMRGDWTELFTSKNLRDWEYEGRFYQRRVDNGWTDETEDCMCPSYLPLPSSPMGGEPSGRMLQLFIAHNKGAQYYIGRQEGMRFLPESHGRMSWQDNAFFAPEAYIDGQGRQIMFAWLLDNLEDDFHTYGWSGVFSIPRALWMREDGGLGIAPVPELRALRYCERETLSREDGAAIDCASPDCCEIQLTMDVPANGCGGITIRAGEGEALLYYDANARELVCDLTGSGSPVRAIREAAPFALESGETLSLNVFIDKSVLEVFANGRQAICRRVYFEQYNRLSIALLAERGARVLDARSWSIAPTNPY